ncbi:hypothetical protein L1987_49763 [Smallanthus sonchifolius]|uniref:Uncharacterized protein n=1 Tax=Smallanthus sonchifolius TaxID=185202 RepID=A0ACB9FUZ7_9ASTR|nr:hypothetical protein L1987_49763 [Smallanthus sonchifolius]
MGSSLAHTWLSLCGHNSSNKNLRKMLNQEGWLTRDGILKMVAVDEHLPFAFVLRLTFTSFIRSVCSHT